MLPPEAAAIKGSCQGSGLAPALRDLRGFLFRERRRACKTEPLAAGISEKPWTGIRGDN
jgi:hypothetical protein